MRILVVGAGVSGRGATRLAAAHGYDVEVYDRDSMALDAPEFEAVAGHSGEWSAAVLSGMDLVVVSPGVPEGAPPIQQTLESGVPLISEMEFAFRHLETELVAVTGTNGKTTVALLIADMLERSGRKAAAAGNIGTALSEVALEPWDSVVVEASSFQLRFIESFRAPVAVLLNVAPDHLDWHGSVAAYVAAKANVFRNQRGEDVTVYDAGDAGASALIERAPARQLAISGAGVSTDGYGPAGDTLMLGRHQVTLPELELDPSYVADLAAAGAAGLEAGARLEAVAGAIAAFRPGPHRRRLVAHREGVDWIDDSKATNPHAAAAAAAAYPSVVLIAGGRNKGLDLSPLLRVPTLRHVVALGEAVTEIQAVYPQAHVAADMAGAVTIAARLADPGDTVLLAPGCASFDMFESYADRGDAFARTVAALPDKEWR